MCHGSEELYKIGREIDLSVQNWHEKFYEFWPGHLKFLKFCTLMDSFWSRYVMFDLKKYRGVIFDGTKDWCKIWRKTDFCFQIFGHRLKIGNIILESKMVERNQNKNSKQPNRPDAVWKLYFNFEINE